MYGFKPDTPVVAAVPNLHSSLMACAPGLDLVRVCHRLVTHAAFLFNILHVGTHHHEQNRTECFTES
jgi:hypothetical protein